MTKENLFFDLDGTIINSKEGIFNSIAYVIKAFNLRELKEDELNSFIGPPLHDSFQRIFGVDFDTADKFVETYRKYYSKTGVLEFTLYDGLKDAVIALSKKFNLFVTTSKPTEYAKLILQSADILSCFKEVSGSEKDKPDSSKEQVVNFVIDKYNLKKETCALIGDTRFDGEGAKLCNIVFYAVSYGFGTDEELKECNPAKIFDTPKEIADFFLTNEV